MSFNTYTVDDKALQINAEQVEINRLTKNKIASADKENVEIFSKIVAGKDVSKYGAKVDKVMDSIKALASAAVDGDTTAKAEINAIRTITIQQPLEARLKINDIMGNVTKVGFNEQMNYEVYELQGEKSRIQANSGAFVFPTVKKRTGTMTTKTATGGLIVDYRELASGGTDGLAKGNEQVVTSMTNQMVLSHITALQDAIKNAIGIKNYAEGITKANVEEVLKKARRFGNVRIMGDYSAVEKLGDLASFQVTSTATDVRFPEYIMEEIMKTGLIKNYKGTLVVEIPNAYNLVDLNAAGTFYAPLLPTTDLWFSPQGQMSALQIGLKGGLTTLTATDINLKSEVTRFDWEFGNYVIPEYIPMIGRIYDSALAE